MRILFFIDSMTSGGKERRILELMKGIKHLPGIEFQVATMSNEIHYKEIFDLDIKIHYLIRAKKRDITIFKRVFRICQEYKPDIVHCWDSMTAIYAIPVCRLLRIKLVNGMVADTPVKQNFFNKYWLRARLTFPFSDLIIGNSKAGLKGYDAPAYKSVCIYNGMNFNRLNKLKDASFIRTEIFGSDLDQFFIVGMVAAFEKRKDYKTLIKAAIDLVHLHSELRFILVGDGTDFEEIKKSIPRSLADRIILLGKRQDVESVINIFDVGVLLTNTHEHGEGISNSILEYMALGKAVIASSGGGTNEIVENNKTGFIISPSNPNEFSEKIEILLNDIELRKDMGMAGRQRIENYFSIDKMVDKFIAVYKDVQSA